MIVGDVRMHGCHYYKFYAGPKGVILNMYLGWFMEVCSILLSLLQKEDELAEY